MKKPIPKKIKTELKPISRKGVKAVVDYADVVWKTGWTYIKHIVDTAREPFLILDENLKVLGANEAFYNLFLSTKKSTEGRFIYDIGNGQWANPQLRRLLEDILPNHTFFKDFEIDHEFPAIGRRIILLNARRVYEGFDIKLGLPMLIILALEDVTKLRLIEERLAVYSKDLEARVFDRTKDLVSRIEQLEALNRLMIDRELELNKLKKEVEDLRKKINK